MTSGPITANRPARIFHRTEEYVGTPGIETRHRCDGSMILSMSAFADPDGPLWRASGSGDPA